MRTGQFSCAFAALNSTPENSTTALRRLMWGAGLLLAVLSAVAYANAWRAPFVFDDKTNLETNRALRSGSVWNFVVEEPEDPGSTLAGRPVARFSFALNRLISGHSPASYRAGNLVVHFLATLLLVGVLRRVARRVGDGVWNEREAILLAWSAAALWALHPLQTAAVTYIVQRVEALAALAIVACCYGFLRSLEAPQPGRWQMLAVTFAAIAAGTKETAVIAPVLVWLLDRSVGAGAFGRALRMRPRFYGALVATWLLLAAVVVSSGGRGGTAGFDSGASTWRYLCTQAEAITTYLRLAILPVAQVFDYGTGLARGGREVWLSGGLVAVLAAGVVFGVSRRSWWGVAGAWFFVCLAPTSSVVPVVSQTIAEHRMYLPLAAIVAALVFALGRVWGARRAAAVAATLLLASVGGTALRNSVYASELSLWSDTIAKRPENARARVNYSLALDAAGRRDEALHQIDRAVELEPTSADAHFNRGVVLAGLGRRDDARSAYRRCLALRPDYSEAHNNLGILALNSADWNEAATEFRAATQVRPRYAEAHSNLSVALLELHRGSEAIAAAERAVALDPGLALAYYNLGNALIAAGRAIDAREAFQRAVKLDPENCDARNNLGNALAEAGQLREALEQYDAALSRQPTLLPALRNSAAILAHQGRFAEALRRYERILALDPADAVAREAVARLRSGNY